MLRLTEVQIDRIVLKRRGIALSGIVLWVIFFAVPQGWKCGLFSGFMLLSLALYGFCFRRWRTEPGLWMLGCLLAVLMGPCWIFFEYMCLRGLFEKPLVNPVGQPINWRHLRNYVDAAFALFLIAITVKFAYSVMIENWKRTRTIKPEQGPDSRTFF